MFKQGLDVDIRVYQMQGEKGREKILEETASIEAHVKKTWG